MANLDVQPKKSPNYIAWILLLLGIAVAAFFLIRGFNDEEKTATPTGDTATVVVTDDWAAYNRNSNLVTYEELPADVEVRSGDGYTAYSVGEDILFNTESATLKAADGGNLKDIAKSLAQRYDGANIRIYGYTDARGTEKYNMQLAEERAKTVKDWLANSGGITADRISTQPIGEAQPEATNATAEGREQNRRVEIVVREK